MDIQSIRVLQKQACKSMNNWMLISLENTSYASYERYGQINLREFLGKRGIFTVNTELKPQLINFDKGVSLHGEWCQGAKNKLNHDATANPKSKSVIKKKRQISARRFRLTQRVFSPPHHAPIIESLGSLRS